MKKSLLGLMAISLIITGGLTYADNEFIVHDTTGGTITVYSQDKSYGITIQDKNLGATVVGTGTASYGYYFQWGNNHGNPGDSEAVDTLLEWNENYNEKGYDGPETRFINKNNINNDIWSDDEFHNNLRGGSGDREITDPTIMMGYDTLNHMVLNAVNRRGPCGEGYHVPSAGEWYELMMLWCSANSDICTGDVIQMGDTDSGDLGKILTGKGLGSMFSDDLFLPFQGLRYKNSYGTPGIALNGACVQYEISTPGFGILFCTKSYPSVQTIRVRGVSISDAYPIRCFKNPYVFTVTFLDDGEVVTSGSVVSGGTWDEIIPTPSEKDGYHFDYRYADGTDTEFDFTSPITGDVKLRAHWTFIAKIPNGIYTGLNNGDITVIWNDDIWGSMNLTLAGEDLEGKYYRGFNYPNTHISGAWNSSTSTFGEEYNSIWGGGSDNESNGYSPNITNHNQRQGPCISGYHIPSRGELNVLVIAWCNLDESCNARYSNNTSGGIVGDLKKSSKWNDGNKLIYLSRLGLGSRFKNDFNIENSMFWSSSPQPNQNAWLLNVSDDSINADDYSYNRNRLYNIRCFKNYIAVPYIFTVNFLNGDEYVWSGDIVSGDKVPEEVISGYNLTGLTKEGYTFSGWIISGSDEMFDVENDIITTGMILNAVWQVNQYTITFKDGDNEITSITADYGTGITPPDNPTKNGYRFVGWEPEVPATMPAENITINAKWDKTGGGSSGGGGGGGGGGSSSKTDTGSTSSGTGNQINSNTGDIASTGTNVKEPETNTGSSIQTGSQVDSNTGSIVSSGTNVNNQDVDITGDSTTPSQNDKTYSIEFQEAYEFAHEKGITTMPTIQEANMEGKLTRIAMAKMLSQYAINVLGKTPDATQNNKFNDVTDKLDSDYDDGVTLAYQLGIMGQNMPGNKFRPNDEVTRAEFATALSRMAYNTSDGEYKATSKYYVHHMENLVKEGIITNDDPNMKELRGYVMIMLMRSAK